MGEKWGFFLLFDAIIAHRCATMRYDSASPKTGAWPSLILAYLTSKALLAFPASIVILSLHIFIAVPVIVIRRQELYKGSTRNIIP